MKQSWISKGSLAAIAVAAGVLLLATPPATWAQSAPAATSTIELAPLNLDAVRAEDAQRDADGLAPRFAIPTPAHITPDTGGTWLRLDDQTALWQLRIHSPGALSLNLGFGQYQMPPHGELRIHSADGRQTLRPFTAADNEEHGQLWTPILLTDDVLIEVKIPLDEAGELILQLTSINVGYRGFGEMLDKSGACNNDVVCPEGDPWRNEIPSVAVISTGGSLFCTGFMVNNTAQDERPFFMTANHCSITSGNAASLVAYWNFESPTCGQHGGGSLSQYQTGAYFRASYATSDFTLVELDDYPDPNWGVTYAGWDRSNSNPTSAVGIHHPDCDEKSISFEYQACTTTSYLGTSVPGDGTHVRITDWDDGTTEPGSSGSPLFDQNHHVVGQLHGGYAACGNDSSDWYGRFYVSWTGGGTNATRLSNWLDPLGTGQLSLDTLVPGAGGLHVSPEDAFASGGNYGGPFTPASMDYLLENPGDASFDYEVTCDVPWVSLVNATGTLPPSGSTTVTMLINTNAEVLGMGPHAGTLSFVNTTDGAGDTTRDVTLQVGVPSLVYDFPLDTDPGWSVTGQWAFGQPLGGGGAHGSPDPTSGHTGSYVYGYNLAGDYAALMLQSENLTTAALDCTGATDVSLRFWRWLGVEQGSYDHAYVRASNNGSTWTTIWSNTAQVADSSWTYQEFDLSAIADNQPTVYIRWSMGPTDGSWQFCGWNIDDIQIWGLVAPTSCHGDCNCDGQVDYGDINGFVDALTKSTYCDGDGRNVDVNGDGNADFDDINPFVNLLTTHTLPIMCP